MTVEEKCELRRRKRILLLLSFMRVCAHVGEKEGDERGEKRAWWRSGEKMNVPLSRERGWCASFCDGNFCHGRERERDRKK